MRILALLLALCGAVPAFAAGPSIVRVFPGWRDAASFKRISEYFDGKENNGGEIVVRTHPDQRGGYYFLVRLANPGGPADVRLHLTVVTPDSATPREFTFPVSLPSGDKVCNLGLTGKDWPDAKVNAVAWKLTVLDADGREVATAKSYLWDKPSEP